VVTSVTRKAVPVVAYLLGAVGEWPGCRCRLKTEGCKRLQI